MVDKQRRKFWSNIFFVFVLSFEILALVVYPSKKYEIFQSSLRFKHYFDTLNNQYHKDWALAGAALYCKPELFQYALENGANPLTKVEIISIDGAKTKDRWLFINKEKWTNFDPTVFALNYPSHYIPYKKVMNHTTTYDCFCGGDACCGPELPAQIISYGSFSLDDILHTCTGKYNGYSDAFDNYQRKNSGIFDITKLPPKDKDDFVKFREKAEAYYAVAHGKKIADYYIHANFAKPEIIKKIFESYSKKELTSLLLEEIIEKQPNKTLIELLLQAGANVHVPLVNNITAKY